MVFNVTFNTISVLSWWSDLLVKETGENHRPVVSHRQTLSLKQVDYKFSSHIFSFQDVVCNNVYVSERYLIKL
jgi:hypothetical protein